MILFFFYGTFTALFAIVAEIMSGSFLPDSGYSAIRSSASPQLPVLILTIIVLATIEETLKYLVIRKTLRRTADIGAIPASLFFGAGFAATELSLLFLTQKPAFPSYLLPVLGILAIHMGTSLAYGYYDGRRSGWKPLIPVFIGISVHTAYNLLLAFI
jgi:hypothetical protein